MVRVRAALPLVACALALGGCQTQYSVGLESTVLAQTIDYQCETGIAMRVERAADARAARATIRDRTWTLNRVDSAAQEKYSDGSTSLYLDGEIAMIESEGRVLGGKCQSTIAMPKAPTMRVYDLRAPTF